MWTILVLGLVFFVNSTLYAEQPRPLEIGLQLTGVHLHKIDETPIGLGVRVLYNFKHVAIDSEVDRYPENSAGNFGETTALTGVKSGTRFSKFGVFGKARVGLMHFGGRYFDVRLAHKARLMMDLGGVLEYYPSARTTIRIDVGDSIIFYGSQNLFPQSGPPFLGTVHNFQPAIGFGVRF